MRETKSTETPEARPDLDCAELAAQTPYTMTELQQVSRLVTPLVDGFEERRGLVLGVVRAAQASGRSLGDVAADLIHAAELRPGPATDDGALDELRGMLGPAQARATAAIQASGKAAIRRTKAVAALTEAIEEVENAHRAIRQLHRAIRRLEDAEA